MIVGELSTMKREELILLIKDLESENRKAQEVFKENDKLKEILIFCQKCNKYKRNPFFHRLYCQCYLEDRVILNSIKRLIDKLNDKKLKGGIN